MTKHPLIVGIPCDHRMVGKLAFHMAGEKYSLAVRDAMGCLPLLIPVLAPPIPAKEILQCVSGLLFTGSVSNVSPSRYGGAAPRDGVLQDERRDDTTLPLLDAAIAGGIPVLCLCRGFQELNVAFGGTLHQHIHEVDGRADHRDDPNAPLEMQYGPAHSVHVQPDGILARIAPEERFQVNSLHGQGIDKMSSSLHADAVAPDGTIEAVSMPAAKGFVLGVQWHPEWRWSENATSRAIFSAFGEAVRSYGRGN
ncbi:MAG TPA: gamma-glutamyl-gamma-aminobutyrate hydrolase family protein [Rhizomicrobium sp.]|nr:gamma-glutamyl-gamma-aminobutyrate hydrolase family protein [Rhizomicrobium sp.]